MKMSRQILVGLVIAILGLGMAVLIIFVKPKAERSDPKPNVELVTVENAKMVDRQIVVEGQGTVIPAKTLALHSEVSGKIVYKNPNLVPGGHLHKGDLVARVDQRDYKLLVAQRKADVAGAKLDFQLEKAKQMLAKRDFERLDQSRLADENARALALRKPYIERSRAAFLAAESSLKMALLQLERTEIRAPFNAMVKTESVSLGTLVGPQMPLASLVGIDVLWVKISLPVERLKYFKMPDVNGQKGALVKVVQESEGSTAIERVGRVVRLLSDLDPMGHMAQLLIALDDPLNPSKGLPMLPGAQVRAFIDGEMMKQVFEVKRGSIYEGGTVWIAHEGKLRRKSTNILWREKDVVLVEGGLSEGDFIISSTLPAPVDGTNVRIVENGL